MDWTNRSCCVDMKHPHHVFLLQKKFEKMKFDTDAKVRAIHFPESTEEDAEPWRKFFYIVPAEARPALSSCLGWGDGKSPNEGEGEESHEKKSTGKKKKKKIGMKPMRKKTSVKGTKIG